MSKYEIAFLEDSKEFSVCAIYFIYDEDWDAKDEIMDYFTEKYPAYNFFYMPAGNGFFWQRKRDRE